VKNDVGDIDMLINNAGIVSGKKILQCPDALIERTMAVNVIAHFWVCTKFLSGFKPLGFNCRKANTRRYVLCNVMQMLLELRTSF